MNEAKRRFGAGAEQAAAVRELSLAGAVTQGLALMSTGTTQTCYKCPEHKVRQLQGASTWATETCS